MSRAPRWLLNFTAVMSLLACVATSLSWACCSGPYRLLYHVKRHSDLGPRCLEFEVSGAGFTASLFEGVGWASDAGLKWYDAAPSHRQNVDFFGLSYFHLNGLSRRHV